jgi:uncharacterized protein YndB with AHSA1/START domain
VTQLRNADGRTAKPLVARASVTINAPRAKVWNALVNPDTIKRYAPVSEVVSDWRENSSIVWRGVLEGRSIETRGTVVRVQPERLLEYERSRPMFGLVAAGRSLANDRRVTIELSDEGAQTRLSLTEQGNMTEREFAHTEGSWRLALSNMKALLEGTSVAPLR